MPPRLPEPLRVVLVRCRECGARNAVDVERRRERAARCGQCGSALPWRLPPALWALAGTAVLLVAIVAVGMVGVLGNLGAFGPHWPFGAHGTHGERASERSVRRALSEGRVDEAVAALPAAPREGRAARLAEELAAWIVAPHAGVADDGTASAARVREAARRLDEEVARFAEDLPELVARAEPVLARLRARRRADDMLRAARHGLLRAEASGTSKGDVDAAARGGSPEAQARAVHEAIQRLRRGGEGEAAAFAEARGGDLVAIAVLGAIRADLAAGRREQALARLARFEPAPLRGDPIAAVLSARPVASREPPPSPAGRLALVEGALERASEGALERASALSTRAEALGQASGPVLDDAIDGLRRAAGVRAPSGASEEERQRIEEAVGHACTRLAELATHRAERLGARYPLAAARALLDAMTCDETLPAGSVDALRRAAAQSLTEAAAVADGPETGGASEARPEPPPIEARIAAAIEAWRPLGAGPRREQALRALARRAARSGRPQLALRAVTARDPAGLEADDVPAVSLGAAELLAVEEAPGAGLE